MSIFKQNQAGVEFISDRVEINNIISGAVMRDYKIKSFEISYGAYQTFLIQSWYDDKLDKYCVSGKMTEPVLKSLLIRVEKELQDKCIEDVRSIALDTILVYFAEPLQAFFHKHNKYFTAIDMLCMHFAIIPEDLNK